MLGVFALAERYLAAAMGQNRPISATRAAFQCVKVLLWVTNVFPALPVDVRLAPGSDCNRDLPERR